MKRVVLLLLLATQAFGAEKWWDAYNRGVAAVNSSNWPLAVSSLSAAIAGNPTESTGVLAGRNTIITYVPYFWLGIAKFNSGDTDGALRAWKTSEDQGAVARTAYYSKLKDWVARAQLEKQREAQSAVAAPKKQAEGAISRAVEAQGNAMSAGGDRTQAYRDAQRRLQEALTQFRKSGTDPAVYKSAEDAATQAASLFDSAAAEGRRLKAEAAAKPKPTPPPPTPKPIEVVIPMEDAPPVVTNTASPVAPVESQAKVAAELAVQAYRKRITDAQRNASKPVRDFLRREIPSGERLRDQLRGAKSDADYDRIRLEAESRSADMMETIASLNAPPEPVPTTTIATTTTTTTITVPPAPSKVDVTPAYRAFATGDLAAAEQMLTRLLATSPAAEAFLLRGCVRYTRAMLSRAPEALLSAATDDFKAALQRNRALRLDPRVFSPKLVARFEQVRSGR
jgi:tetratricopeptide (TPR) repeat protein